MSANKRNLGATDRGNLALLTETSSWPKLMLLTPKFSTDAFYLITASLVINLLALALPLALMQVYDRIIPNSSYGTMGWLMIGVISAIILETVLKIMRSFNSNWLSSRMEHILNTDAFNYFLSAKLDRFELDKSGVHYERFNAINIIKSYFSGQILLVLLDIPFAVLFLSLLYYIGGGLCFFTLGLIVVFISIILIAKKKFEKYNEDTVELNKENLDFVLETLGGIHTVKAMNMEDRMHRKFENIQARTSAAGLKANRWKSLPENSAQFIVQLNLLGIIFLGAELVINGTMTIGAMTACTMLASRGLQPIIKVAGSWLRFSEVTIAQKQLEKIIALGDPSGDQDISKIDDVEGTVFFDRVRLDDAEGNTLINTFSAEIYAGEFVGVSGRNAEQTTALMLMLCGMYTPTEGDVFIDEYLISSMDHSHFNGRVEYLPPKVRLFNGTVLDNISMFNVRKQQIALDTAAMFELDKFVADLPNGYGSVVTQRSNESLPLGLIQRAGFARALVTHPRVLIIDRTLNNLDRESFELVLEILETLRGKCTIFFVSDYGRFPLEMDLVIKCTTDNVIVG